MLKKQVTVRGNIIGALVYPCLLIFVSVAVLAVMLTFVLPLAGIFAALSGKNREERVDLRP